MTEEYLRTIDPKVIAALDLNIGPISKEESAELGQAYTFGERVVNGMPLSRASLGKINLGTLKIDQSNLAKLPIEVQRKIGNRVSGAVVRNFMRGFSASALAFYTDEYDQQLLEAGINAADLAHPGGILQNFEALQTLRRIVAYADPTEVIRFANLVQAKVQERENPTPPASS